MSTRRQPEFRQGMRSNSLIDLPDATIAAAVSAQAVKAVAETKANWARKAVVTFAAARQTTMPRTMVGPLVNTTLGRPAGLATVGLISKEGTRLRMPSDGARDQGRRSQCTISKLKELTPRYQGGTGITRHHLAGGSVASGVLGARS